MNIEHDHCIVIVIVSSSFPHHYYHYYHVSTTNKHHADSFERDKTFNGNWNVYKPPTKPIYSIKKFDLLKNFTRIATQP